MRRGVRRRARVRPVVVDRARTGGALLDVCRACRSSRGGRCTSSRSPARRCSSGRARWACRCSPSSMRTRSRRASGAPRRELRASRVEAPGRSRSARKAPTSRRADGCGRRRVSNAVVARARRDRAARRADAHELREDLGRAVALAQRDRRAGRAVGPRRHGLSLVLTFFVMAPVAIDMVRAAASRAGARPRRLRRPAHATERVAKLDPRGVSAASRRGGARASSRCARSCASTRTSRIATRFASSAQKLGHASTGDEIWVLAPAFVTTRAARGVRDRDPDLRAVPGDRSRRRARRSRRSGCRPRRRRRSRCRSSCCCSSRSTAGACSLDSLLRGYV